MSSYSTLTNLINLKIPEIARVFLEMMQDIVDNATIQAMTDALAKGDVEEAFRATNFTPGALQPILKAVEDAYESGALATAENFPRYIISMDGRRHVFRFNMRNPVVEGYLANHSSELIADITDSMKQNIRISLEAGMIRGDNPKKTALDIVGRIDPNTRKRVGGTLGLTNQQNEWVQNVESYLSTNNSKYFTLKLRDKRFDATVRKAIEEGKPLNKDKISKLLTSYKNRALKLRADNIAITESHSNINKAEFESHRQLIENKTLPEEAMRKFWDNVGGSRVRDSHIYLENKYKKKGLPINEPYVADNGDRMNHPGDTSLNADASNIVRCKCRNKIKVDWDYNVV